MRLLILLALLVVSQSAEASLTIEVTVVEDAGSSTQDESGETGADPTPSPQTIPEARLPETIFGATQPEAAESEATHSTNRHLSSKDNNVGDSDKEYLNLSFQKNETEPSRLKYDSSSIGFPATMFLQPMVIAPLAASVGIGVLSVFPIRSVGFLTASAKTFRVARMYKKSMLFSKTQTAFALAFLSLVFASLSGLMGLKAISFVLLPVFFGLVVYHNVMWYSCYSYCAVDGMIQRLLLILPVFVLLGYVSLISSETIQFEGLQAIAVAGSLVAAPSTVFTALSFRGSRLGTKWTLVTAGLVSVMAGLVMQVGLVADMLVLSGCGLVVAGQYNLSTKYATE